MCVYLRCTFVVVPIVNMETRIMCMHVYHSVILVPGYLLHSYRGNLAGVRYISSALQCVMLYPAIWWLSVEVHRGTGLSLLDNVYKE